MTNIRDWCISRQLWWGQRIPAWYGESGEIFVGRDEAAARAKADAAGYKGALRQDEDVVDTWFSSWLWPFATFGWPENTKDLQTFYPGNLLSTAPDLIFFWVARMIMGGIEFTHGMEMANGLPREKMEDRIPFRDVYFHNIIRDQQGRKMSKSLGNSPDPIDLVNKYGTDAVRFTLLYLAPLGQDVRFGEESCEHGRNFANKIYNATRFVMMKRDEYRSVHPEPQFESKDTELNNVIASEAKQSKLSGSAKGEIASSSASQTPRNDIILLLYKLSTASIKLIFQSYAEIERSDFPIFCAACPHAICPYQSKWKIVGNHRCNNRIIADGNIPPTGHKQRYTGCIRIDDFTIFKSFRKCSILETSAGYRKR